MLDKIEQKQLPRPQQKQYQYILEFINDNYTVRQYKGKLLLH